MLKPHGLSPTQYNALRILRGAGDQGRACSEIAERMINRDPDITRLVDRLERRGFAVRSREGQDRRVITTRITPAGLELLQTLDGPVEEFNRKMLGAFGGTAFADVDPPSGSHQGASRIIFCHFVVITTSVV